MALKTALVIDGSSDGAQAALAQVEKAMASAEVEAKNLASSANVAGASLEGQTRIAGTTRLGMQELSYQISDVAEQFSQGVWPQVIFAQQSGQVIQALQLMSTEATGVLAFLGGPWGIGISAAAVALSPFIGKLFDTKDALHEMGVAADDTIGKLDALAKKSGQVDAIALADAKLGVAIQQGRVNTLEGRAGQLSAVQRAFHTPSGQVKPAGPLSSFQRTYGGADPLGEARSELEDMKGQVAAIEMQIRNRQRFTSTGAGSNGSTSRAGGGGSSTGSSSGSGGRSGGLSDAEQAQKALDLENQRYAAEVKRLILDRQLAALRGTGLEDDAKKADMLAADFAVESQFPELARSTKKEDQDRLGALKAIAEAAVTEAYARKDSAAAAKEQAEFGALFDKMSDDSAAAAKRVQDELAQHQQEQVRTLAGLYRDLMTGGTKAIWADFKRMAIDAIAEAAAKYTASFVFGNGASGGGGGLLGKLLGAIGVSIGGGGGGGTGGGVTSGVGLFDPSMFGGGRAGGGPVSPGQFYAVNERSTAPGLFFPLAAGMIQPPGNDNRGIGGASPVEVRVTLVDTTDLFKTKVEEYAQPVATQTAQAELKSYDKIVGPRVEDFLARRK